METKITRRPWTNKEIKEVGELYKNGVRAKQLAAQFDRTERGIHAYMSLLKVKSNKNMTEATKQRAITLFKQGLRICDIAYECGISPSGMGLFLKRNNITR